MRRIYLARGPLAPAVLLGISLSAACGQGGADGAAAAGASVPRANLPPVVDAGQPQLARGGALVALTGAGSDPEGGALSYAWHQTEGPTVSFSQPTSPVTFFEAPSYLGSASLGFELRVTDTGRMVAAARTNVLVTTGFTTCEVTNPPARLNLDSSFYTQYCDVNGHALLAPTGVSDLALQWVRHQMLEMLKRIPLAARTMVLNGSRIVIKDQSQLLTEIPEYNDLYHVFPEYAWDTLPGVGAVVGRPVTSTTEENVLCYEHEPYAGFSVFIHELAHSIHLIGLEPADPAFGRRLKLAYDTAMASGLWAETYSARNDFEYWAEGVGIWFNAHWSRADTPSIIDTREELAQYDDGLYRLLREYFTEDEIDMCPPAEL